MRFQSRLLTALAIGLLITSGGVAQVVQVGPDAPQEPSEEMLKYAETLNEFSERRRLNTLFVNEQSPFNGVQVGYVNTASGNLTFVRRDIVLISRLPLVFGRVYDSRLTHSADFGPGWKIAPMEYLVRNKEGLTYTDASGSSFVFIKTPSGIALQTPFYSDFLHMEVQEDGVELTYRNLWTRFFESVDGGYRLRTVRDNNANVIDFGYDELGRVEKIAGTHGWIILERDGKGRIVLLQDHLNRQVGYQYDDEGRLSQVVDLGGNAWAYEYDGADRLIGVQDPKGNRAMDVAYSADSRVSRTRIYSVTRSYRYDGAATEVSAEAGGLSRYEHSPVGLTQLVTSNTGTTTQLRFDRGNRVIALMVDGEQRAEMSYDESSNLTSLTRHDRPATSYHYNWHQRVVTAGSSHAQWRLSYDVNGNLESKQLIDFINQRGETTRYSYNEHGDLTAIEDQDRRFRFTHTEKGLVSRVLKDDEAVLELTYNARGRVTSTRFSETLQSDYEYNELGLRVSDKRSDEERRQFEYDAAGNLTFVRAQAEDISLNTEHVVNEHNQITKVQSERTSPDGVERHETVMEYDSQGNPRRSPLGNGDVVEFRYDEVGRFTGVKRRLGADESHRYRPGEPDLRLTYDGRTGLARDLAVTSSAIYGGLSEIAYARSQGSLYGAVAFSETTQSFGLTGAWGLSMPDTTLLKGLERTQLSTTHHIPEMGQIEFNRPSNAMFLPPEYTSVNCCIVCPWWDPDCTYADCEILGIICFGAVGYFTPMVSGNPVVGTTLSFSADAPNSCENPEHPTWFVGPWYRWDFGDGTIAHGQNVSHAFGTSGIKIVSVLAQCCDLAVHQQEETVSVSVAVPPCNDSGYTYHKGAFLGNNLDWVQKIRASGSNVTVSASPIFTVVRYDGTGFSPNEPNERFPTAQQFNLAFNDLERWLSSNFESVCGTNYRVSFGRSGSSSTTSSVYSADPILLVSADLAGINPGAADTPGNVIWLDPADGGYGPAVTAHEFGHNLGFDERTGIADDDIMLQEFGTKVYGYHAKVLEEEYD